MTVVEEVMEIVRTLEAEGFGVLAGDLLAEISSGREVNVEGEPEGSEIDGKVDDKRVEFSDGEQLAEAARILRLRLVEPERHLAEADDIASRLSKGAKVAIRFVDDEGREDPSSVYRSAGESKLADALEDVLDQIAKTTPAPRA